MPADVPTDLPDAALPPAAAGDDPWSVLRQFTQARIALGHTGTSLPTAPHLAFQLAHARARDAVHRQLDGVALGRQLAQFALPVLQVHSAAPDRHTYLQRPDLGRRLDATSHAQLVQYAGQAGQGPDLVFALVDGLSARAIQDNAVPLLAQMLPRLAADGLVVGPLVVVQQGRVAVGDEVGEVLQARLVAVLIGERPGLSSPDSMGVYLTYAPRVGTTDAARNCLSNIRAEGMRHDLAAHKLHYLVTEACRRQLTGVALKDEAAEPAPATPRLGPSDHKRLAPADAAPLRPEDEPNG